MKSSNPFIKALRAFFNYLIHPLEGKDNKLSGKRVIGTVLIVYGIKIGWYGLMRTPDHLADVTMLSGGFFAAGGAFWGMTTWATEQEKKRDSQATSGSTTTTPAAAAQDVMSTGPQ